MSLSKTVPVSVVVPCYRCSETIKRAVSSIASQTMRPIDVILIDDASGDDTTEVLSEVKSQYGEWIRIAALDTNLGAASARNLGWSMATQPYVAFLDSDDAWHPKKIEIQYAYMNDHPDVVLTGHGFKVLTGKDLTPDWVLEGCRVEEITKGALLLSNRFVTPSVMVRRDIQQRFRADQRHMEDHMLWLDIVCCGGIAVKLSADLAAIYKRPYGASGLSAQIWQMEIGDLGNYRRLYLACCINWAQWLALSAYSWAKFMRRLTICWWGYLQRKMGVGRK